MISVIWHHRITITLLVGKRFITVLSISQQHLLSTNVSAPEQRITHPYRVGQRQYHGQRQALGDGNRHDSDSDNEEADVVLRVTRSPRLLLYGECLDGKPYDKNDECY